jgi:hypothetical protein
MVKANHNEVLLLVSELLQQNPQLGIADTFSGRLMDIDIFKAKLTLSNWAIGVWRRNSQSPQRKKTKIPFLMPKIPEGHLCLHLVLVGVFR